MKKSDDLSTQLASRGISLSTSTTALIHAAPVWADAARQVQFEQWLQAMTARYDLDPATLQTASSDASFRRYFRIYRRSAVVNAPRSESDSFIIMDAPPAQEDCRPFVAVAGLMRQQGLHVPNLLDWQESAGFLLLSDLGLTTYLSQLNSAQADDHTNRTLYHAALSALVELQQIPSQQVLPHYDAALLQRELELFPTWYLTRHCQLTLTDQQNQDLARIFADIIQNNLAQPKGFVHRDYHSRNLMVCQPLPGILDFQDAVNGPLTYDVVSLLRDAYIEWDETVQIDYAVWYWEKARQASLPIQPDFGDFWRDFEWMGLQRQLKVLGIFARLAYRDGKTSYLADIPRVWRYAYRVTTRYNGLGPLARILEAAEKVVRQDGYTF